MLTTSRFLFIVSLLLSLESAKSDGSASKTTDSNDKTVCLSTDCIKASALLLNNMDATVDPCEDFYDFSCGGFMQSHFSKNGFVFVDTVLDDKIKAQLRRLLSHKKKETQSSSVIKTQDYFTSCTDESRMKEVGTAPLKEFLDHFGGWPVVEGDKWDEESNDWFTLTTKMASSGLPEATGLIGIGYFRNYHYYKNREFVMLEVFRPYTFLVSGRSLNSSAEQALVKYMVGVATYLGADQEKAEQEMEEVWQFINDYKEVIESKPGISPDCNCTASEEECDECETWEPFPNLQNRNETEKGDKTMFITIEDLYNVTNEVDWLSFIRKAYSSHVNMSTTVAFRMPDPMTLKNMTSLLANTPKRVVANYVMWRAMQSVFHLLRDPHLTSLQRTYENTTEPRTMSKELKWTVCLNEIGRYFRYSLTALYYKHYLNRGEKEEVADMYDRIREIFLETLDKTNWLSVETREKAKDKLLNLTAHIAYPDELKDDKLLDSYYETLLIDKDEYFSNYWNLIRFTHKNEANLIGQFSSKSHWPNLQSILSTNAFYYHAINAISIPATQIRGIYFSQRRIKSLNYGSLGSIIGHEVLHGFNELGVHDETNRRLNKWWKEEDNQAFKKQAKCIINQYEKFGSRRAGKLDGSMTLDENLSDNEGIRASYEAYQRWVTSNGAESFLPGLQYTPNQLFWIAYGNSWCKIDHRPLTHELRFGQHSPPKFRVLGALSNMEEFSKDFHCPLGSRMNPKEKCSVWGTSE